MKEKNIKLNFILNLMRMFLGTFFILITIPYVTRVLGTVNLGKVEYALSIVQYFLLFSALGIPSYGIREVSKVQNNKEKLSKLTFELIGILLITTTISYIVFSILITNLPQLVDSRLILLVIGTNILFTNIGIEWFYVGLENQLYVTIRFLIMRIIGLILLFLLVKSQGDYIKYGIVLVVMTSGSNIFNIINLRNHISLKGINLKDLDLKRHLKPILTIFAATLSVSIYLQLDTVMIGSMTSPEYVSYYSVANKLVRLVMIIVTALGTVLVPRLSKRISDNDLEGYRVLAKISYKYILLISIPAFSGILTLSKEIIDIMAGKEFAPAIITMQIVSPILVIVGIAYFLGFQILFPFGKEKYYTIAVSIAAIVNFIFNYIFIPKFYQNGAAIGTVIAELIGVVVMLFFTWSTLKELEFFSIKNLKYFLASIIMVLVILILKKILISNILILILSIILGGGIYIVCLVLLNEDLVIEGLIFVKKKLKNRLI